MTLTVDYDPTTTTAAPARPPEPMVGAPTIDTARHLAGTWHRWASTPDAFATELATELVAALALAATLAELPATVLGDWLDSLDEPVEILTAFGHLDQALRLDTIATLPAPSHQPIIAAARPLTVFAGLDTAPAVPPAGDPVTPTAEWIYDSLVGWLDGFFFPVFERSVSASKQPWCAEWFQHPEAVQRLNALWRAWEDLRTQPGAEWSTWWTHHLDPHLRALCDVETGTFSQCGSGHRTYAEPLPHDPPPPDWPLPTATENQP